MLAALVILGLASLKPIKGSVDDLEQRRHTRENYPFGQSFEAPEYEIVIARYRENATTLAWLADLPPFYQVTVINKVSSPHHGLCINSGSSMQRLFMI